MMNQDQDEWTRKIANHVGARIEAERSKHGLSREALAKSIGVRYNAVADWENGARLPKLESLLLLTQAFGFRSVEELLGGPFGTQRLLEGRRLEGA